MKPPLVASRRRVPMPGNHARAVGPHKTSLAVDFVAQDPIVQLCLLPPSHARYDGGR
jgi:hypothetical protein